ncbi:MAG TPA: MIP/aquaporin family protein [Ensifer sp.]|nr:MIP/aquaporin family protein [Ensifer sp.]
MSGYSLGRRLAAEFIGTGLLLATVVGSGIMAESLSGGNVAMALLGNTIPTGAILFVLITMFGPISGAHFNPVVTFAFSLNGDMGARHAVLYGVAQVAGAIAGVWLAHLMFDLPLLQLSEKARFGTGQWLSEAVATFGLLFTIFATLRANDRAVPQSVALYIVAAYWFTASTSFANPAVTIARALSNTFSGIRPQDVPAFVAAQIVGCLVALALQRWLLTPMRPV